MCHFSQSQDLLTVYLVLSQGSRRENAANVFYSGPNQDAPSFKLMSACTPPSLVAAIDRSESALSLQVLHHDHACVLAVFEALEYHVVDSQLPCAQAASEVWYHGAVKD